MFLTNAHWLLHKNAVKRTVRRLRLWVACLDCNKAIVNVLNLLLRSFHK